MKHFMTAIALLSMTFALQAQTVGCLEAENGQYPDNTFIPNCLGVEEIITDAGFSGEFSKVSVTNGVTYEFKSSLSTDFITISDADGTVVYASGLDIVTWTADADQVIRFYVHTNENCGYDYDSLKYRKIKCTTDITDYCQPTLDCGDGALISKVEFGGVIKESDCSMSGYNDFTDNIMMINSNYANPIAVTVGYGWYQQTVSMWIDFNENFIFDQDEFFLIGSGVDTTITNQITLPEGVVPGKYRMRLRLATVPENNAEADMACDTNQTYGETEDYTLLVTDELLTNEMGRQAISLYPNPINDLLNISSEIPAQKISITNLNGQIVFNAKVNQQKVDLRQLQSGVYLVKIFFANGQSTTQKFVKK